MDRLPGLHEVPPAPRTPSEEARRLVLGAQDRRKGWSLLGFAVLALGALLALVFCWGLPADVAIALSPRSGSATLLSTEPNTGPARFGGATRVSFQYEAGGTLWTGESSSSTIRPEQTGLVAVEYAALNPAWGRLAGGTYAPFGYLGALSLLLPLAGGLLFRVARRRRLREERAFTLGFPVLARVTFRGQDHSIDVAGRHPFLIRWEFRVGEGVYQGALRSVELLEIKAFGEAEQVVVLYDPSDPKANTLFVP